MRASTVARHRCMPRASVATKSVTRRTCRRHHLLLSMSTSLTRRWGVIARIPPRHAGLHQRSPWRDARGRPRGRFLPPKPRPNSQRRRRGGEADTTTKSFDIETIDVEEDEGDVQSPRATTAMSPGTRAVETPRLAPGVQGLSTSSTSPEDDAGSNKRLKKAPPKPCKPGLRSATK
jgi:hypothetical protein